MQRREIDLLYVTSPANLYYLLGHQSVWWDGRNVTGLAVPLDAAVKPIMFDTWDHAPGWSPVVEDGVTYGEHGFYFPEGPQAVAAALRDRGLIRGRGAPVKLLANGEAPRGLVVCVDRASAAARAKVEAAGGKVEIAS